MAKEKAKRGGKLSHYEVATPTRSLTLASGPQTQTQTLIARRHLDAVWVGGHRERRLERCHLARVDG